MDPWPKTRKLECVYSETTKSRRKVVLLLLNYGYFYESFFRTVALHLAKENEVHVWFEDAPRLLREESICLAKKDAVSGLISDSRVFTPVRFSTSRRNNLKSFRSKYSDALNESIETDSSFDQIYVLNSSRLSTIAFLDAMKIKGSEIIVVRPMGMEKKFKYILQEASQSHCYKISKSFSFKLFFLQEVLKTLWIQRKVSNSDTKINKGKPSSENKDSEKKSFVFALPTRELFGYFFSSLPRGLRDWYESVVFFANTRITSRVLLPSSAMATLLSEIAPGPDYLAFAPPCNPNVVETIQGVGILFPPAYVGKTEIWHFSREAANFLSSCKSDTISARLHPHQSADSVIFTALKDIEGCEVSNLDFEGFVEAHSIFIVYGRNSSLPVVLKTLKPYCQVIAILESEDSREEFAFLSSSESWMDQIYGPKGEPLPKIFDSRNAGESLQSLL